MPLLAAVATNEYVWPISLSGTCQWHVVAQNAAGTSRAPATGNAVFEAYPAVTLAGNLTIAANDFTYENKVIVKDGGVLTLDGSHTFANLVLINGATVTHSAATTTWESKVDLTVLHTLSISSNSAINVNGKGYLPGRTYPNTTTNASTGYSGGSYGGLGNGDSGVPNPVYGDFRNPNELGSSSPQAPGGGLVRIQASELVLDGQITANSLSSGSGGGIHLQVGRLAGGGLVSASGWTQGCCGREGGGGRIAIYYDILDGFDLTNRVSATATGSGGPGTVYLQRSGEAGVLMVDRKTGGVKTTPIWLPAGATNFTGDLVVRGIGTVAELQSADLIQPANVVASAGGRFVASGDLVWANLYLENAGQMRLDGTHQVLAPMVINRGTAEVNGVLSAPDVVLTNAGALTHTAPTATNEYRLELVVSNTLSISSNSAINVNGKGYLPGRTYPNTTTNASTGYSGGSYGGLGNGDSGVPNPVYGDFRNPNELGSSSPQAPGGGLVRIQTSELALDGQITANSLSSGSGGGIHLQVGRLAGGGLVSASGWTQGCCGREGGGGRIAIYYDILDGFDLTNRVSATATGSGGPGTVYLERSGEAGVLMVDRKTGGVKTTPIWLPAGATNYTGDLVVRGTGTVAELQSADLIQPANVIASAGGRFVASGDLVWANLSVVDAGQMRLDGTHQVLAPMVINRGTAEVNGVLSAPDVVLTNMGALTHSVPTATNEYRLELIVSNTLYISGNSAVNVSGKGYPFGRTYPNTTSNASTGTSGGSYGGLGSGDSGVPNPVYGDFRNPNELGSGGYYAANGGGLARIRAADLILDGQIAANSLAGGAGSGGGIYLDVGRLSGAGQIYASGGDQGSGRQGGGGRVAIYYDELDGFDVTNRASAIGPVAAGPGTVYLERNGDEGRLLIDRKTGGVKTTPIWLPAGATNYTGDLVVRGTGTVAELQSADLIQPANVVASAGGRFVASGDLVWANLYLENAGQMRLDGTHQVLAPLVINRGTAEVNGVLSAPDVVLTNMGALTHTAATATNEYRMELVVSNTLSISSNSAINVVDKGYLACRTYPNTTSNASGVQSGGSYGGLGGKYGSDNVNPVYGDFRHPNEVGSGGGSGPGGGLVRVTADLLDLQGQINASASDLGNARGSGGGIFLDVGTLSGSGQISSRGGHSSSGSYASGGGGRIAIVYGDLNGFDPTNQTSAAGRAGGAAAGGPGTVYWEHRGGSGTLMVDRKMDGAKTTPIWLPAGATNYTGDLVVRGTGTVAELQSADLIQPANVVASAGGRFVASGDLVWANLYLENAGQMRLDGTHQVLAPLVINRGTAEVNGVLSAPDVVLTNMGALTHTAATATNEYRMELVVSNTLSISSNSAINVVDKGYLACRTYPNTTSNASGVQSGGSYGGLGGKYGSDNVNPVYGDFRHPNEVGSGGGSGPGGGLVRVTADLLDLQGQINASASDLGNARGSGGGIFLDVGTLSGSGQISSRGGHSSSGSYASGGGGRIAIVYGDLNGFDPTNQTSAAGRAGGAAAGGPGTVYWEHRGGSGTLMVDRKMDGAKTTPIWLPAGATNYTGDLVVRGTGTVAELQSADRIQPANVVASAGGRFVASGDLTWGSLAVVDAGQIRLDGTNQVLAPLVINRGTAEVNGVLSAPDVVLTNAGVLTHTAATATNEYRMELAVSNTLSISTNSSINVAGKGYLAGRTYLNTATGASTGQSGGSYGGLGGNYNGVANVIYGDVCNPNEIGSGGGSGGPGGGLVRLAAGTLELAGVINASGTDGSNGRGSGGGIYLDVGRLVGEGQVLARGGNANYGGGGGGRVAIYYKDLIGFSIAGNVNVAGGTGGASGSPGTICATNVARVQLSFFAPTGHVNSAVSNLTLTFATPLDDASLGLDDMSLAGPAGAVGLSDLVKLSTYTYRVDLAAPATDDGLYTFVLGTNILTEAGNPPDGPSTNRFTIDRSAPAVPALTSHLAAPATNDVRTTTPTLAGTRETDTAIWINGVLRAGLGEGTWSWGLSLTQGLNVVSYWAVDRAGNISATNQALFFVDSVAPVVSSMQPASGALTNLAPGTVRLGFAETGSGVDEARSERYFQRSGITIPGSWAWEPDSLVFTPAEGLMDGVYAVSVRLYDRMENTGALYQASFTVDTTAPAAPAVNPVSSPTILASQSVTGAKEANTLVRLNGSQVVAMGAATNWSHVVSLVPGANQLSYTAVDAAGNESVATEVEIVYDNEAPGPVAVTAVVTGVGTRITLGWAGYDELANGGDIANYTIYQGDEAFTDVGQAAAIGTRAAGQKSFVVSNLVRNATKHYAVMARDLTGLANSNVTSVGFAPEDTVAPADPANLAFDCFRSNLVVKWDAPADADGDLAGYRVYVNDATNDTADLNWDAGGGLLPATAYPVRVASLDSTGNESSGTNGWGYTLLDHPADVVAISYSGLVDLTWSATAPTQYVKEYRVFASPAPFADIGGMTAQVATAGTLAAVTGLVNDVAYWFAVAAVNLADGIDTNVTTVAATPRADTDGPEIQAFRFEGAAVTNGMLLQQPGTFTVQAWDRAGLAGAELLMNGTNCPMAASGGTNFNWFWNLAAETDGVYSVELRVTDAFDNPTTLTNEIQVALAPPANAPAISSPANGAWLNSQEVSVAGLADRGAVTVTIYGDGQVLASGAAATNGAFNVPVTLVEGTNRLQAAAANRAGEGPVSGVVTVCVDRATPAVPAVTNFQLPPATNQVRTTAPALMGTREADTAVWVGGVERVPYGESNWSYALSLAQGLNSVPVQARDRAGNVSETNLLLFFVDSIAPAVVSVAPANGALTNVAPTYVRLGFTEAGSGVDEARSEWSLQKGGIPIPGTAAFGTNALTLTPSGGLLDGTYAVAARLVDQSGNTGTLYQASFTVDMTPPAAPGVGPVTTPTINASQQISGTREANTAVRLNGVQVVAAGSSTNWSHTVTLVQGLNSLSYTVRDAAGNVSPATVVEIVYDNTAPDPVIATADGRRNGLTAKLDWPTYDEAANGGDIAQYRVYRATAAFADIGSATQVGAVNAGVKTYLASNLTRAATYHFAVVAVDQQNQFRTDVTSVPVTTEDVVAPADPASLSFDCFRSNLVVRWTAPANPDMDLAGYRVYFNGATNAAAGQSWDAGGGLQAATGYPVRVASLDLTGNESAGTNGLGVTLLDHPTNVVVETYSGVVDLQWSASMPTQYVKEYRVYGSTAPFAQVGGMSAASVSKTPNASVAGLADNQTYYLAVAAVNLSGGMDTNVATIDATPRPDTNGPAVSSLRFDDAPVTEGLVIRRPGTFRVNAWDRGGVSRVEFRMDGVLLGTDANGSTNYATFWNVAQTTNDGLHDLDVRAYDTRANETVWQTNVAVELAVPLAPAITQPTNGKLVNKTQNWVAGTGAVYASSAMIYVNGEALTGTPLTVSSSGAFGGWTGLPEGSNVLRVAAMNRAGEGAQSAPVGVTVDLSIPSAPIQLTATAKAGGVVQLSWVPVLNAKGYWIYRSTAPFEATTEATRLTATLWGGTYYQDVTPADGTYYYRVATVNSADTEGPLSPEAQATTDRTAPTVVSVGYSTTGAYSPSGPRFGRGKMTVSVLLNEALQAAPFFSLNPVGSSPISLTLKKNSTNALLYTGSFDVGDGTACGTAYAVFSGWDVAGNRGTEIQSGGSVLLDACGPTMTALQVTPSAPIQNDFGSPATVAVMAAFNVDDVPVGGPSLTWRLSQSQPDWTDLQLSPLTASSWSGSLILPADAGQTGESLEFAYRGVDDLGNTGTVIAAQSSFQVYQGELPPLESPWGLTGEALPGGQVRLTWQAVENAVDYVLFRGPASDDLAYLAATAGALEYQETVGSATNWYAVASLREANGQISTSAWSSAVRVVADDQAPAAPTDVQLTLAGNGMYLTWTPPAETNLRYNVYRDGTCLESLAGRTPVVSNVPAAAALDRNPLAGTAYYVVSAKDATGNESGPSACAYTNLALLPVSSLKVRVAGTAWPVVSWTHPARGEIDGFNLYLDSGAESLLLGNLGPTAATYEDSGFTGQGTRQYRIAATDASGGSEVESISRSVLLPAVQCTLDPASTLKKGVMNRIFYQVGNLAGQTVDNLQLKVQAAGRMHVSEPFDLPAGSTADVSVVVGGYTNLAAVAVLTNTVAAQTLEGEVEIVSTASLATGEDKFVAEIANDELLRGVPGKVRFTLHNTSPEEIEIVMAVNAGNSPEVRIKLETPEGMVLASGPARQSVGAQVVTIAGGVSVARIPAGESFTSSDVDLTIPTNAPQSVRLKLEIDKIHYHHGDADHVEMSGLTTTRAVELFETIYWAAVTNVAPTFSLVATNVLIEGHAVNRATGNPQMNAPVKLVVSLDGFERIYVVTSDVAGAWAQWFEPLPNESGLYKTWAVHPSLVAKPVQAEFAISGVWVTPSIINLTTRRNLAQVLPAYATVGKGLNLTNLHLLYLPEDQPGGVFAPNVQVTATQNVAVAVGGQRTGINFTIEASSEATNAATLVLRMVSDGCPEGGWGKVTVNAAFVDALPVLNWTPSYVQTGVAVSNQVHPGLKLWNSGHANLENVSLALKTTNGMAVPGWVILNTATNLGTIAPSEERQVSLTFAPTGGVAEATHEFRLFISASNYPTREVALYAQVDNSGRGSALFKVTDIYTGTTNQLGGIVQGLQGARISLQRESGLAFETNRTTDVLGEAMIENLPEGSYVYRVTAPNHETSSGRIWIRPGVTTLSDVVLKNILVTVEWSVREITLEDRYELVLTTVYQTDVPVAVVVTDPVNVNLPTNMVPGDVFNGEYRLVNQGLIRAEHVQFWMPADDASYKFEIMCEVPDTIEPKQAVRIPYRVTR
ncbi:MAG: Ig-like domain-containing protein, partial [Kiritimatiellia bacterium]